MKNIKKVLSLLLMCAIMVSVVPVNAKAETSAPARVKQVKAKEVTMSYKGWLGEGNKKTKVKYQCMQLSWKKVRNADGYVIYRYGNASKAWHKIKTITKAKTTKYILPEMYKNKIVKIKVVAYKKAEDGSKVYGTESKVLTFKSKKTYEITGKIKTKNYNPIEPKGWYRFYSEEAFIIQNKYRTDKGIEPLIWDESLYEISQIRSKELSKKFSHIRPNGEVHTFIIDEYYGKPLSDGIPLLLNKFRENIAYGYYEPKDVMKAWKNSTGHYNTIKMKNLKYGAISAYFKTGGCYWTSTFSELDMDEFAANFNEEELDLPPILRRKNNR